MTNLLSFAAPSITPAEDQTKIEDLQVFFVDHHTPEGWPILYRAHGRVDHCEWGPATSKIWFAAYKVVGYTAQGVWISQGVQKPKFVLLKAERKWAHLNKKDALYSFLRRKRKETQILLNRMQDAEAMLLHAEQIYKEIK